jgi:hypothetical protein
VLHTLTVQGSTGNVGIGTSSPLGDLSIGINGNASGGNIQLGVDTNNANKYTAIASKAYASDAQPEGFITLASQAYDGGNETFIGGGLGELDASTASAFLYCCYYKHRYWHRTHEDYQWWWRCCW